MCNLCVCYWHPRRILNMWPIQVRPIKIKLRCVGALWVCLSIGHPQNPIFNFHSLLRIASSKYYGYIMVSVYTHIYPLSPTSDNPLVRRPGWKRSAAAGKLVLVFAAAAVAVACHCFSFRLPTGNMNNNHKNTQPSSKQHQIKVANKKKQKNEKGKQMVYECLWNEPKEHTTFQN